MSGASTNISGPCPKASGPGLSEPKSFRLPEVKGLERIETAQRPKVVQGCHFLFVGHGQQVHTHAQSGPPIFCRVGHLSVGGCSTFPVHAPQFPVRAHEFPVRA